MAQNLWSLAECVVDKVVQEVQTELQREKIQQAQKVDKAENYVAKSRSQIFSSLRSVVPEVGSLLAVGLGFGVLEHTGIYVGDGYVIEQHGDDVLKKVTLKEFQDGDEELYARGLNITIQIACDSTGKPLAEKKVATNAQKMYDNYKRRTQEYSLLLNNCHQFCWSCIAPKSTQKLVMFSTLEEYVAKHYGYVIYWDQVKIYSKKELNAN